MFPEKDLLGLAPWGSLGKSESWITGYQAERGGGQGLQKQARGSWPIAFLLAAAQKQRS